MTDNENMAQSSDFTMDAIVATMTRIKAGQTVTGKVVQVTPDEVYVNIGYKADGIIKRSDLTQQDVKEGDELEAEIVKVNDGEGNVVLSQRNIVNRKAWEALVAKYDAGEYVKGVGKEAVKGGLIADVEGVRAFVPASQLAQHYVDKIEEFVGKEMELKIIEVDKQKKRIVASRKAVIAEQTAARKKAAWENLEEGAIIHGVVRRLTQFGAFVDVGGVDGLIHITDLSWGHINHPSEVVKPGQEVDVKILSLDRERERIQLGYKQLQPRPWDNAAERYPEGCIVEGKVVRIADFGAFVELQPGLDGLVHISQCAQNRVAKVTDAVQEGQIVRVKVLSVDTEKKRISLGMKQIKPNPWELVGEKYPEGTILEGVIKNITEFGMFIGIEDGIDGLIHVSDISWTKKIRHPNELFKVGDTVQAKVLTVDQESEKFTLGIKQLTEDPWTNVPTAYPVGGLVKGIITNITDFGLFVEVEEGIEGLVHVSELSNKKVKTPAELYKEGEEIQAKIIHVSAEDRRLGLSIKQLKDEEERKKPREYSRSGPEAGQSLGDLLKQKFEESEN